jgi:glycosyltransferase involved in cell wall biosynthesis
MKVSVVLPAYNESGHIVQLVQSIIDHVPKHWSYEVLLVDDNSPDGTCDLVRRAFSHDPGVVPILRTSDRGLAKSIRTGIERATGDRIVVMDSDFTHHPEEIPRLLHVGDIYDIVIGSRFCPGGRMQDVPHYLASMVYNWFLRVLLRTQVQDNMGGYFTIRAENMRKLPFDEIFDGYGEYFFRVLYFAERHAMSIVEIPAEYAVRPTGVSKSRFFKMMFAYAAAAIRLRLRHPRR